MTIIFLHKITVIIKTKKQNLVKKKNEKFEFLQEKKDWKLLVFIF